MQQKLIASQLTNGQINSIATNWRKGSKIQAVFINTAFNPGIQTFDLRRTCRNVANVPDIARKINKILLSYGFIMVGYPPLHKPHNADSWNWYIEAAPTITLPIKMASNDPII